MPTEPIPTQWTLPDPRNRPEDMDELVGVGADLQPGTLLAAYRRGIFPMPLPAEVNLDMHDTNPIGWWSPNPRGILPLDGLRVSRSLRKACRLFEITVDSAFDDVIEACSDPAREHGWIDHEIKAAYGTLFDLGWVHSIEAWNVETGQLAGGLYGVTIGCFFAGESMFHHETDASKVALVGLVELLNQRGFELLDVQWPTEHLRSLGVIGIDQDDYLERLAVSTSGIAEALDPLDQPLHL